jgi:TnpA family transposase
MPVEFLTDDEAAAYGRYVGVPSRAELERVFFLDDEDRALIEHRRGDHMRLGFGLQLVTVRYVGMFLEDPLDVPVVVLDFVAEQLNIADPSCVKRYTERAKTRFDHQWEIRRVCGLTEFAAVEAELRAWVAARSWTSGDGPKAIFTDAVGWLREREVLLPGVSTLVRLVARVRDDTTRRLWGVVEGLLTAGQRSVLDQLLEVPPGSRVSDLERWRKGPPPRGSGPAMIKALDQVAEVMGLGMAGLGADGLVPPRRLAELSRYGMSADASQIRRHPDGRRLATLLATVRFLEGKSVDDTLELMDLLMSTELLNKAQTAANKEKVRKQPQLARASARLAVAVEALFDSDGWGDPAEAVRVGLVWEAIEAVVSRSELRAALVLVNENVPPADAGEGEGDDWRVELVGRFATVSGFLKMLPKVIAFGANAEGARVLAAMEMLPDVLAYRSRLTAPLIPARMIDPAVVTRSWKRLVFGHPAYEGGAVNRHAYTFCVLEQFYRHLKRREIHADASTRWRNPQAQLLEGEPWEAVRGDVLTTLGLLDNPEVLLADHTRTLDAAYREVGGRLAVNTEVRVDDAGKIHLTGVKAVEEPPSLVDLRARTTGMLPRVDLPEVILEVMSWEPQLAAAFTAASGGRSRLEDLEVSIAACLAAHSMNVGYRPIAKKGAPALERSRLSHVFQNYFRPETIGVANAPLVARQAGLRLAQCWGGGLVAAVDGMRFVVPIPAVFARPNRKFFGARRGMTWLNVINDQGIGRGAKVVSGTVRDSLHMVDVIFGLDGGELPEIVVSDTGSYSDLVFGLLELLGISYRPALADLPDQKGWRISPDADYGPLNTFARGRIDLRKIRRNWDDILRVVASIYTGTVRAYDVVTMLQRDGHPTALGEAIASYGRIFKSLHILAYIDVDETYRRDIKGIRNLQEGRHALARKICHGKKGELFHRYERGLENQLGVLGLVLNCVVLWTTVYLDAAVRQLQAQGYPVRPEDMTRLSPFVSRHLGVHGAYSFLLPDLAPGAIRDLRDPEASEDDDDET